MDDCHIGDGNTENATDCCVSDSTVELEQPITSKKQLKRLLKTRRFLEIRKLKRAAERERKKIRRKNTRENGGTSKHSFTKLMVDSTCSQKIAIDMSFESLMSERDIRHVIAQLAFCYAKNRRMENPFQLTFVNFDGLLSEIFYSNHTRLNWDVIIEKRPLVEAFKKSDIVYLTSDSENSLNRLDQSKVYVIGGIVDHNSRKGLCLDFANKHGLAHARLPIEEYVKVEARKVLTINQVFEILADYTVNLSWKESFFAVIPKRKNVKDLDFQATVAMPPKTINVNAITEPRNDLGCESNAC